MRSRSSLFSALLVLAITGVAAAQVPSTRPSKVHANPIPPRLQWEANGGYCGEVSFISAGLYFGQYVSQYEARICAIGNVPQNEGELLLGLNDRRAARALHLEAAEWDGRGSQKTAQFLTWVKRHVVRGNPVIIGVYNNERRLYGNPDPTAGDPQYDHIVPVMRIRTGGVRGDRLTFSDNGLWGRDGRHPFHFSYSFRSFPGDRAQANRPGGPLYSLPDDGRNFGVAITGVADRSGDTLAVRLFTNKDSEVPKMPRDSTARPAPEPVTLTAVVSGLVPGTLYRLYRYDVLAKIPDAQFNAHAADAVQTWDVRITTGTTFTITQDILSDEVAAYRCVRADAP